MGPFSSRSPQLSQAKSHGVKLLPSPENVENPDTFLCSWHSSEDSSLPAPLRGGFISLGLNCPSVAVLSTVRLSSKCFSVLRPSHVLWLLFLIKPIPELQLCVSSFWESILLAAILSVYLTSSDLLLVWDLETGSL